jgi:phosphohistidine swiveling domain-containing protein
MERKKQIYKKIFNRAMFLLACENFDLGERVELHKATGGRLFFDPLFIYEPGKGIGVYYNFSDPKQAPQRIVPYYNKDETRLLKLKDKFYPFCREIKRLIKINKLEDFNNLFELTAKIWPLVALSNIIGDDVRDNISGVSPDLVKFSRAIRKFSNGLIQLSHEKMIEHARKILPADMSKSVEFLLKDEITSGEHPGERELKKRKLNYVFHKGELFAGLSGKKYFKNENIEITGYAFVSDQPAGEIKGKVAYPGKIKGRVVLVIDRQDRKKVKAGDILVSPMTTPEMVPEMKKAVAIVTDEGGITCHAAIVAREMKKPCIIGTGNATQILHNGDMVEVDANKGVAKIIKRK